MSDRPGNKTIVILCSEEDGYWQVHCELFSPFAFSCSFDSKLIAEAAAEGITRELREFVGDWVNIETKIEPKIGELI